MCATCVGASRRERNVGTKEMGGLCFAFAQYMTIPVSLARIRYSFANRWCVSSSRNDARLMHTTISYLCSRVRSPNPTFSVTFHWRIIYLADGGPHNCVLQVHTYLLTSSDVEHTTKIINYSRLTAEMTHRIQINGRENSAATVIVHLGQTNPCR